MTDMEYDPVTRPRHYQTDSGLEAIEVIEAFFAENYHLGNAFKYLARAGKKHDRIEDLDKAIWYVQRYKQTLTTLPEPDDADWEPKVGDRVKIEGSYIWNGFVGGIIKVEPAPHHYPYVVELDAYHRGVNFARDEMVKYSW